MLHIFLQRLGSDSSLNIARNVLIIIKADLDTLWQPTEIIITPPLLLSKTIVFGSMLVSLFVTFENIRFRKYVGQSVCVSVCLSVCLFVTALQVTVFNESLRYFTQR